MKFIISKEKIDSFNNKCSVTFYCEEKAFSGVNKIANKVRKDIERVVGIYPRLVNNKDELGEYTIIYGTIGQCRSLADLMLKCMNMYLSLF